MKIDNQYSSDPLLTPWYETADRETLIGVGKDFLSAMFKADDEEERSNNAISLSRRLLGDEVWDVIKTVQTLLPQAIHSLGSGDGRAAMEAFASVREALGKAYGIPFPPPLPRSDPVREAIVDSGECPRSPDYCRSTIQTLTRKTIPRAIRRNLVRAQW